MTRGQGERMASSLHDRVRELLDYNPETGALIWRVDRTNGKGRILRAAGSEAGGVGATSKTNSYRIIKIDGRKYLAHRIAWLIMTGSWPAKGIDHADGDGLNNRWINLREANQSQNSGNQRLSRNNTSGAKGVSWSADKGKWRAQIKVGGKARNLGYFATPEDAHAVYVDAAKKYFGEFARAEVFE